jgi:two-component system, OmpR family, sensor kinase
MSLRLRLSLTFAGVVALVVAVLGVVLYVTMAKTLAAEMDRRLQVRADEVTLALWPGPDTPTLDDFQPGKIDVSALEQLGAANVRVYIFDEAGRPLASYPKISGTPTPLEAPGLSLAIPNRSTFADMVLPGGQAARALSLPIIAQGRVAGGLQVIQLRGVLVDTLAGLRALLLLLGSAAVLIAGVCGWLVAYRGLRPLSTISRQAARITAKADFGLRLDLPKRQDEVGRLAATMDQLLDKVDETLRVHRDFLADTSHELRNPLLAIRTNLELLNRVRDGDAREECIHEAIEQVERMSRLVADLLLLAQVESRLLIEERQVDLAAVAARAAHQAQSRTLGQKLVVDVPARAEIVGDEGRLNQILENLLDNAIKHTPAGGTIAVRVLPHADGLALCVEDTGEGIAPEHLPHIFDRTFRAEKGRSVAGYGLGLAIVKHLAEAHGGNVEAASELGSGTRITVWLRQPSKVLSE